MKTCSQGDTLESVVMLDKQGRKYLCFLPKEEESTTGWTSTQQNVSTVMMETEKQQVKLKTPDELLQLLNEKCLVRVSTENRADSMFFLNQLLNYSRACACVQQEGWWSYEFCHQKEVKQLHVEANKVCFFFSSVPFSCF